MQTLARLLIFSVLLLVIACGEEPRPEPYQVAEGVMLIDRWGKDKTDHTLVEGIDFAGLGGSITRVLYGDIAADSVGNVYVTGNDSIQKFTPNGELLWEVDHPNVRHLAAGLSSVYIGDDDGRLVKVSSLDGELSNNFDQWLPMTNIAVDEAGSVYAPGNGLITKFTANSEPAGSLDIDQFSWAKVGVDGLGNVFVQAFLVDFKSGLAETQVHVFSSDGEFIRKWDVSSGHASIRSPITLDAEGFAVDSSGRTYIGGDGAIRMFTSRGELVRKWSMTPSKDDYAAGGRWDGTLAIAVSDSGNLYAQDGKRVVVFSVDVTSP